MTTRRPNGRGAGGLAGSLPAGLAPVLSALFLWLFTAGAAWAATETTYVYDADGRLVAANMTLSSSTLGDFRYAPDAVGNILTATTTVGAYGTVVLSVAPEGSGTVTLGGADSCATDCQKTLGLGRSASVQAYAAQSRAFLGWSGGYAGTDNPHVFTMTGTMALTAHFGATGGKTDADPLSDVTEAGQSGRVFTYDGDGSGVADYLEDRVASLPTVTGKYLTVGVSGTRPLLTASARTAPSSCAHCPYGAVDVSASYPTSTNACLTYTLYLPNDARITDFYAYDGGEWIDFAYDGTTGAQIYREAARTRITVRVCDGKRGDSLKSEPTLIGLIGAPGYAAAATSSFMNLLLK